MDQINNQIPVAVGDSRMGSAWKVLVWVVVIAIVLLSAFFYFWKDSFNFFGTNNSNEVVFAELETNYLDSYSSADVSGMVKTGQQMVAKGLGDEASIYLAKAYLNQGSLSFQEKESAPKALAILEPLLVKYPDEPTVLLAIGYANEILENYAKAITFYNKAVAVDAGNDLVYVQRGHAYDLKGDLDLAEKDYLKAYSINNTRDVTLVNLARHYFRNKNFDLANQYAQKTIDITKLDYVRAIAAGIVANIYIEGGEYQNAIDYLDYAIDNNSKDPTAYEQRGYAILMLNSDSTDTKKVAEALVSARKDADYALSLHSESSFAVTVRGIAYLLEKKTNESKTEFSRALALVDKDITLGAVEKNQMRERLSLLLK